MDEQEQSEEEIGVSKVTEYGTVVWGHRDRARVETNERMGSLWGEMNPKKE